MQDRKTDAEDRQEPSRNKIDSTLAILKGVATGVSCPVATVPLDMVQTNFQVNQDYKFNRDTFWKIYNKSPMKAYPFTVAVNSIRYSTMYTVGPRIQQKLEKSGMETKKSEALGNLGAGMIDGAISGPINVIKQKYFTDPANSKDAFSMKTLPGTSAVATPYVVVKYGLQWAGYNKLVKVGEEWYKLKEEKRESVKGTKVFFVGAVAGLAAALATQPIDGVMKRRIDEIQNGGDGKSRQSLFQLLSQEYKKHGVKMVKTLFFRGASLSCVRVPVSSGINNLAVHVAGIVNEKYKAYYKK